MLLVVGHCDRSFGAVWEMEERSEVSPTHQHDSGEGRGAISNTIDSKGVIIAGARLGQTAADWGVERVKSELCSAGSP